MKSKGIIRCSTLLLAIIGLLITGLQWPLLGQEDGKEDYYFAMALARRGFYEEAVAIAEKLNDKTLRFQAEVCLYKQAHDQGDDEAAQSLHRRLRKLALWVPSDTQELATYKRLTAERKASMAGPLH